jgi:hypothetical protein
VTHEPSRVGLHRDRCLGPRSLTLVVGAPGNPGDLPRRRNRNEGPRPTLPRDRPTHRRCRRSGVRRLGTPRRHRARVLFHRTRSGRAHHRSGLNRRARAASGSGNQRSRMARHRRQVGVRSSSVSAPVDAIPAIVFHRIPHRVFGVQRRSVRCVNLSLVGEFGRVRDGTAGFVSSVPASLRSRSPSSRCRARTCRVCAGGCRQSAWPTAAGSPRRSRRSSPAGTRAAVQPSSESSRSSSERSPSPRCDSCEPLPHPSRRQQISLLRESLR